MEPTRPTIHGWRAQLHASASSPLPGDRRERFLLFALLGLAVVLRFWGFPHIPYTHDEISALVRVDFPTLGEAIDRGVSVDAHPPATHAFLWCWTQLFGIGDGAVKAPFIVMSVLALVLLHRFAHAWAGGATAVVCTALLATLQYIVMYGQIARPYAMGFLTIAFTADQLTRYIALGRRRALIGTMVGAVLSAYTHHFALMLAAFIIATGLFLVHAESRRQYLLAAGIALLAYLPNVPLFLVQLGVKGLDNWLTPPTRTWLPDHLWWIAHCSLPMAAVLLMLVAASLVLGLRHGPTRSPLPVIGIVWGLLPLVVGYAYSIWRAPVLQYSVLLFSFPFCLIALLGGLRHLHHRSLLPMVLLTTTTAVTTLVFTRRHYETFYASKYEAIVNGTRIERPGRLAIIHAPPEVVAFYRKLWCINPSKAPHLNLHGLSAQQLDSALRDDRITEVFYGQTSQAAPENIARIQHYFPILVDRKDMVEGQTFTFQRHPTGEAVTDHVYSEGCTVEAQGATPWTMDADLPAVMDSASTKERVRCWDLSGRSFGIKFEQRVDDLVAGPNDVIEVRADVELDTSAGDLSLVAELLDGDSSVFYRSLAARDIGVRRGTATLITAIKLADIPGHGCGHLLRTYLYNPSGGAALVSAVQVAVRQGDPVLYGFFQPLLQDWRFR
jgi:hypothetical protein